MELWKEVKKKQGSSEDYVMNALATRLPEFNHDPENGCTSGPNDGAALDDNAKARLIVSRLDQKTHARLANTIAPKKIEDMDLQTTKATLLKLFGCRKSVFTRRYECTRMKYHSSMPLSDFVAEVNRNVENAEFAAMTGEQFKCLIFVSALEDDDCVALRTHVLKKMKAEPDTTLTDLLEECNDYSELQSHIEMIGKAKLISNNLVAVHHRVCKNYLLLSCDNAAFSTNLSWITRRFVFHGARNEYTKTLRKCKLGCRERSLQCQSWSRLATMCM
ncbi:unnamed protein product [Cylicocyclus nassatus]|uniref:DUF7083 domain-containing protein n=1 Tax=Cylicocyclus nassatus TaxID=53992 RepID=A0AA36DK19_CYLNA|nr:unnamed protein product [Cylicocyclus nassatus]